MSDQLNSSSSGSVSGEERKPYSVRACRGHFHVHLEMGNGDTEDLIVRGDPFKTREDAQAVADKRNAGLSWEEIESRSSQPSSSSEITNLRTHETAVLIWNRFYPVGTPVLVKRDDDSVTPSETVSKAELLGGHTAVVWLKDIRGAYLLERVSPRINSDV